MICFKSIGSSVLAMSLVFGDKVIMLDLSKWHKSNRYGFLTHRQKWHSLNRNAWHYETEITGTNRTEVTKYYLLCNFAQYGTAKLENHTINLHSYKFSNLSYQDVGITGDQSLNGEKINIRKVAFNNEYLEIGNEFYKNLGVQRNKDILLLEKIDLPKNQIRSTQIGYKAIDFSGSQFKKQNTISLDSLKGKYVLLDFWGTWCGPCIQEIPNLKTLYDNTDKLKFEIISIVVNSPIKDLEQMMSKYGITWPQIISDDSNKIKEKYGIIKYPSTFLISPEGTILAKDLRGKELEAKIESLLKK